MKRGMNEGEQPPGPPTKSAAELLAGMCLRMKLRFQLVGSVGVDLIPLSGQRLGVTGTRSDTSTTNTLGSKTSCTARHSGTYILFSSGGWLITVVTGKIESIGLPA